MHTDIIDLMTMVLEENRALSKQIEESTVIEKKLITTKELYNMYGISTESQKQLRMRLKHPLPYIQIVENGSIKYSVNRIDKWLENYEKNVA